MRSLSTDQQEYLYCSVARERDEDEEGVDEDGSCDKNRDCTASIKFLEIPGAAGRANAGPNSAFPNTDLDASANEAFKDANLDVGAVIPVTFFPSSSTSSGMKII